MEAASAKAAMERDKLMKEIHFVVRRLCWPVAGWGVLNKSTRTRRPVEMCAQRPASFRPPACYRFCNSFTLSDNPDVLVASFSLIVIKVHMSTFAEPPSSWPSWPNLPRPRDAALVSTR